MEKPQGYGQGLGQETPDAVYSRAGHDSGPLFAPMVTEASAFGQGKGDIICFIILEEFPNAK